MNNVSKYIALSNQNIFMYFDYREYLKNVLETLQKEGLSLRAIQESAGLSGSAFFSRILDGSRPLSVANAKTLAKAWGMNDDETE